MRDERIIDWVKLGVKLPDHMQGWEPVRLIEWESTGLGDPMWHRDGWVLIEFRKLPTGQEAA